MRLADLNLNVRWLKSMSGLTLTLTLACSHAVAQGSEVFLSPIVLADESSKDLCPDAKLHESCLMDWPTAIQYCNSIAAHLPTAREYARILEGSGTVTLEASQVTGEPPAGFYLVECLQPDGATDAFYMNHSDYKRPPGEIENHLLWTASSPPGHPQYAHVYYDEWGGGGGDPKDHLKSKHNAVQCIQNN